MRKNNAIQLEDDLIKRIGVFLSECGFLKKGRRWVKENEKFIFLIEFQKSRFSKIFFINYGFFLKGFSNKKFEFNSDSLHLEARYDFFHELNIDGLSSDTYDYVYDIVVNKFNSEIVPLFEKLLTKDSEVLDRIEKSSPFFLQAQYATTIEILNFIGEW